MAKVVIDDLNTQETLDRMNGIASFFGEFLQCSTWPAIQTNGSAALPARTNEHAAQC